ncbi:MAG: SpoIIE family protein phosphatase [Ignavibacterium sp.]|nr:SpoIIE family protein phosphatase [Ignavibacterium sp.]
MRKIINLLFILTSLISSQLFADSSKDSDTLFISADNFNADNLYIAAPSLGSKGEILWRFSTGDASLWADPLFDDSKWELVNPWLDVLKPEAKKWKGTGWFRKIIQIDSSLIGEYIGMYFHQDGASEIYLNGKKIFAFGKVANNKTDEEFYDPGNSPYVFSLDSSTVYTIAVRYSNHSNLGWEYFYNKFFGHLGFSISLFHFNKNIESEMMLKHERTSFDWGINGFTLAFSLIFFLLYFFYSKRKQNLYFAFFVFGIALMSSSTDLQLIGNPSLELIVIYRIVQFIAFSFVFTFFLLFIYETVYNRIIKLFWLFLAAFIVINGFAFFGSLGIFDNMMPLVIVIAVMTVESIRVFVVGIIRKVENIWILTAGAILFLLLVLFNVFFISTLPESVLNSIAIPIMILTITVLPILMAIYLAKTYGKTQNDLEEKIIKVQELSALQIEQERKNAELQLQAELERAENHRKTQELEQARRLQLSMLPTEIPKLTNLDIAVYMKTATEVGGDYYDFHFSENKILTLVVADATGHGLNAGMFISVTKGLFQSLANKSNLEDIISQFNTSLISMKLQPMYLSLSLVRIQNNQLKFAGAGMPPALYYNYEKNSVEEIESSGPPLGGFPNFNYEINTYMPSKGDIIILMSDGFAERMNKNKIIYGWNKGKDLLSKMKHLSSNEIIKEFVKASDEWGEGSEQDDDITFVILKVK